MEKSVAVVFGKVLREFRKKAGFSQEQLGLLANLQRNYISMLELGERQPTLTTILKLATALNIKSQILISLVEEALDNQIVE